MKMFALWASISLLVLILGLVWAMLVIDAREDRLL